MKFTEAYEEFDYPRAFQTLQRFCAVDLSAFYFDVLKGPTLLRGCG
jgi:isoleucyl-tRNA synthetase